MIKIKIGYVGQKKSGKSSIIRFLFEQMKPMETLNLVPTKEIETTIYKKSFLEIHNTEFPGDIENFDNLTPEQEKLIKEQDIFIYVHQLKQKTQITSPTQLQNYFTKINLLNDEALIYTFFHQSDQDFTYQGQRIDESKKIFFSKFKKFLENNYQNEKVTSIYDFSLNMAMSTLLSNFIQLRIPLLNKLMTEVTKSSNVTNLMLWDITSRLYVIKDDVPIDDNKFSLFLEDLKMYYLMINFYSNKNGGEKKEKSIKKEDSDENESQIVFNDLDDNQETIYIKQFSKNFCFLVNMNENFRDNKIFLDYNLQKLKEFLFRCINNQCEENIEEQLNLLYQ